MTETELAETALLAHLADVEQFHFFQRTADDLGTLPWEWQDRKHRMVWLATQGLWYPDRKAIRNEAGYNW